jgi:Uma2 family endonuclease
MAAWLNSRDPARHVAAGSATFSASEITLHLDPPYEPIPDVIAVEGPATGPYPTTAFEIVVENLTPQDTFSRILRKCRLYAKWGIRQIIVIDPEAQVIWRSENGILIETDVIATRGEAKIPARALWDEVDLQYKA